MITIDDIYGPDPLDEAFKETSTTPEWWVRKVKAIAAGRKNEPGVRLAALKELGRAGGWYAKDHKREVKHDVDLREKSTQELKDEIKELMSRKEKVGFDPGPE